MKFLRENDVLVAWRFDRLGRSLPHLIEVVAGLDARGIGFRTLTETIDVFGALGQFERDLIQERTKAGLSAAAARGCKRGKKARSYQRQTAKSEGAIDTGLQCSRGGNTA